MGNSHYYVDMVFYNKEMLQAELEKVIGVYEKDKLKRAGGNQNDGKVEVGR